MNQTTHEKVLYFINLIKGHKNQKGHDAHEILNIIYTNGNCYMFARTLQFVFPQAILYTTIDFGDHITACIDEKFYDITGELLDHTNYTPLSLELEKKAMTWCYSHEDGGPWALVNDNDIIVNTLDELVIDSKNNLWKVV